MCLNLLIVFLTILLCIMFLIVALTIYVISQLIVYCVSYCFTSPSEILNAYFHLITFIVPIKKI